MDVDAKKAAQSSGALPSLHFGVLISFCLALAAYAYTVTFQFTYDDLFHIVHNSQVTDAGFSTNTLRLSFLEPTRPGNLYRPITLLSLQLNHLLTEITPWSYHFFNILLYSVCCALVYLLYRKTFSSYHLALFGSLLFVVHPVRIPLRERQGKHIERL